MQVFHTKKINQVEIFHLLKYGSGEQKYGEFLCTLSSMNSLSLNLGRLWVLQLPGLVHIHEEVLQQHLSIHQVVCIHLLVDQGQVLVITLCVL